MPAAEILGLVEGLRARFGLERSFKISAGALIDDRYLVSLHRTAFGPEPAARLKAMAIELGMPARRVEAIDAALDGADIVHLGYEGGGADEIFKVYFEYAGRARRAMAAANPEPTLVHLAFKWSRRAGGEGALTRYTWTPCPSFAAIEARLDPLVPEIGAPNARACALALLERVRRDVGAGDIFVMEVEEPGNPRKSVDINVYNAELRLDAIAGLLAEAGRRFDLGAADIGKVIDGRGDRMLGHLSAGIGRGGEEFITIYFGVESH